MREIKKTPLERERDEKVIEVRNAKIKVECAMRIVLRRQKVLGCLPTESTEYKEIDGCLVEDKWSLVESMRNYEAKRKELAEFCQNYHMSGNTFIEVYELVELLAEK